jgi:DNA-binding beta-propeller fold protein YncE
LRGTIPAPELPSGPRSALIIATATYSDQALSQLRAPAQDAAALAGVLGDAAIGGFAVTQVVDQDEPTIRRTAARFLDGRGTGELVLVYLSCHGLLDARGRLFFAATDTDKGLLSATAVEATWLTERLEECRARQQILILDCCFSGAFARGGKGAASLEHKLPRSGRGRVVLTASRQGEYSFEGEALADQQVAASVFTAGLVHGLATGEADADRDGLVSVEDAFDYAARHVLDTGGAQTPTRWVYAAEGSIVLARNPTGKVITPAPLPESINAALDNPTPHVRIGAVHALGELLSGSDPALALAAREALEHVAEQDSPRVAAASREILQAAQAADAGQDQVRQTPATEWSDDWFRDGPKQANHAPARIATRPVPDTRPRGGTLIATASYDKTARIWDTATGKLRTTLKGHNGYVWGVASSPDGTHIATASYDKTARIWDTATGNLRTTLTGHEGPVWGVAFSPDGTLIATASYDKTARIWDTATGNLRTTLKGHTDGIIGVAFSPNGILIATASRDKTARIWDTATGYLRTTLTGHTGMVHGVAFSPNGGTLIATASADKTARIWDTATGKLRTTLKDHQDAVNGVAFSPNGGTLIATASADKTARIWDTATGKLRTTLTGHDSSVYGVMFSPDGSLIATASGDKTARIWDTATGTLRTTLTGHTDGIIGVLFASDGA